MQEKKNPISIKLKDGTQLYLSWDEFKNIKGRTPQMGRIMSVIFQRRPDDLTDSLSKIIDIDWAENTADDEVTFYINNISKK